MESQGSKVIFNIVFSYFMMVLDLGCAGHVFTDPVATRKNSDLVPKNV